MSMYNVPKIYNLTLTTHNVEYSLQLSADTRKVLISERSGANDLQLAYKAGDTVVKFLTIRAGSSKWIDGVYLQNASLYFLTPTNDSVVVEIEEWI